MKKHIYLLILTAGAVLIGISPATAQVTVEWVESGVGAYNNLSNWSTNALPDALFDLDDPNGEQGVINNGGTAQVLEPIFINPRHIRLGQSPGDLGTLEVHDGGELTIASDIHVGDGDAGGEGHVRVLPGGTLVVEGALRNRGAAASSMTLGGMDAGTATVTVSGESELRRNIRVIGSNVDFTTGSLTFGAENTLTAEITGAAHSPLKAGSATLGGNLVVEFNGHTPAPGDSWTIVDAGGISGGFSSVISDATFDPGFGLFVETVSGGMNGRVAELAVGSRLLLSVDRASGEITLNNLTSTESFDIDGYLITSPGSSLDPSGWSSFSGANPDNWQESNPDPTHVGELSLGASRVVGPNESVSLGSLYGPSQFGVTEDLAFEYNVAGEGTVGGLIEYTGPLNNLVLIVDPETGEAALQNQSQLDVEINGYLVTSDSSSLNPDGWVSLSASGLEGWVEANPAADHVGELNLTDARLLAGRGEPVSLGTLYNFDDPAAEQDLDFTFNIAGGEVMTGVVQYGEIPDIMPPPEGIVGDYNNNGQVEQADLSLVLLNWGSDAVPDGWLNDLPEGTIDQAELSNVLLNWGNTSGLGVAGVPEPSTFVLLVLAGLAAVAFRARAQRACACG